MTANQFDLNPAARRNASPVTFTEPAVPSTRTVSARPPHSPCPERDVTVNPVNPPIDGQAATTADAAIVARHRWCGFALVASPTSATAGNGNVLAAVQPPDDDENIVSAIGPDALPTRRT
ncbi:unannotated protein [freshwater metagenome]|uniref:Unannotated protein n=1 Tax=freshwater metagenome TaxID=449393 RepID=A0A6J6EB60_9ZZZZ